jgi:hypothetical protein
MKKPNDEGQEGQLVSLDAIANEIGTKGATGDAVLVELAKGVKDAVGTMSLLVSGLVGLAKGKGKDDDEDDDDDDDTDHGDDDSPGYQDMQMAVPGVSVVQPVNGGADFDVTQFLLNQSAQIQALVKGQTKLAQENAELRALIADGIVGLGKAIQQSAEAQLQITAPLAKAMAESREAQLQIPAGSITPTGSLARPKPRPVDAAFLGGSERAEKQALAKGFRVGLFDAEQLNSFRRTRRFVEDATQNAQIRASVEAAHKELVAG